MSSKLIFNIVTKTKAVKSSRPKIKKNKKNLVPNCLIGISTQMTTLEKDHSQLIEEIKPSLLVTKSGKKYPFGDKTYPFGDKKCPQTPIK